MKVYKNITQRRGMKTNEPHATTQRRNEKLEKEIMDYGLVEIGDIATKSSTFFF